MARQKTGLKRSKDHVATAKRWLVNARGQVSKARSIRLSCRERMLAIMSARSALRAAEENLAWAGIDRDGPHAVAREAWKLAEASNRVKIELLNSCIRK